MALTQAEKREEIRSKVLFVSAKMFLEKGYTKTSLREISAVADVNIGSVINVFRCKENILCEIVKYVLEEQFKAAAKYIKGTTDDKILFYAAETALQLHIAESSEHMRDLYSAAYSMPDTTDIIQHTITGKLEDIFRGHLPNLETKDFFELEIASGGIMRGFMTVPCDMYFTMERKVKRFLETTFLVYRVPDEKINEAIEFVSQFDFEKLAAETIEGMLVYLKNQTQTLFGV